MVRRYGYGLGEMRVFPKNYWGWLVTTICPPLILFSKHPPKDAWLRWLRNAKSESRAGLLADGLVTGATAGSNSEVRPTTVAGIRRPAQAFMRDAGEKRPMTLPVSPPRFAMACYARSGAMIISLRALENLACWIFTRSARGVARASVRPEHTRLQPLFGLANYAFAETLPNLCAPSRCVSAPLACLTVGCRVC